jgi:hypothetical protein
VSVANPYQYLPPTEASVIASLENIWGEMRAHEEWNRICNEVGFKKPGPALSQEQLAVLADYLLDQGDIFMIVGYSLKTRLKTWHAIQRFSP